MFFVYWNFCVCHCTVPLAYEMHVIVYFLCYCSLSRANSQASSVNSFACKFKCNRNVKMVCTFRPSYSVNLVIFNFKNSININSIHFICDCFIREHWSSNNNNFAIFTIVYVWYVSIITWYLWYPILIVL